MAGSIPSGQLSEHVTPSDIPSPSHKEYGELSRGHVAVGVKKLKYLAVINNKIAFSLLKRF